MSCCGNQRATLRQDQSLVEQGDLQYWTPGPTDFEYAGSGELTVTGPLTGIVYRFTADDRRVQRELEPHATSLNIGDFSIARNARRAQPGSKLIERGALSFTPAARQPS
mgnify:CR=1 FL=1